MPKKKDPAAVKLGRKGGKEIAKRGSQYFSQLRAKRKKRKGGRMPQGFRFHCYKALVVHLKEARAE